MSVDSIGNFLTIIRNGIMASKRSVTAPHSKMSEAIANILKSEGFVQDVNVTTDGVKKNVTVVLRYVSGESVIHEIDRVSTPGRKLYANASHLKPVIGKLGISILTTNKGIMTDKEAKDQHVGGEIICTVW